MVKASGPHHHKAFRNNYLAALGIAVFFLTTVSVKAQIIPNPNKGNYGTRYNRGAFDSTLYFPTGCGIPTDTTFLFSQQNNGKGQKGQQAAFYYDSCGHHEYIWDPSLRLWHVADSSSGSVGTDSAISTRLGIKNTIVGTTRYLESDTGYMATRARLQKSLDSVNSILLHYSDSTYYATFARLYKVRDSLNAAINIKLGTKLDTTARNHIYVVNQGGGTPLLSAHDSFLVAKSLKDTGRITWHQLVRSPGDTSIYGIVDTTGLSGGGSGGIDSAVNPGFAMHQSITGTTKTLNNDTASLIQPGVMSAADYTKLHTAIYPVNDSAGTGVDTLTYYDISTHQWHFKGNVALWGEKQFSTQKVIYHGPDTTLIAPYHDLVDTARVLRQAIAAGVLTGIGGGDTVRAGNIEHGGMLTKNPSTNLNGHNFIYTQPAGGGLVRVFPSPAKGSRNLTYVEYHQSVSGGGVNYDTSHNEPFIVGFNPYGMIDAHLPGSYTSREPFYLPFPGIGRYLEYHDPEIYTVNGSTTRLTSFTTVLTVGDSAIGTSQTDNRFSKWNFMDLQGHQCIEIDAANGGSQMIMSKNQTVDATAATFGWEKTPGDTTQFDISGPGGAPYGLTIAGWGAVNIGSRLNVQGQTFLIFGGRSIASLGDVSPIANTDNAYDIGNPAYRWRTGYFAKGFATTMKVGDVSVAGDASAALDVNVTNAGFLPPRLTTTQQNAISSPAAGLVIYNTDSSKLRLYNGTAWVSLGVGGGGGGTTPPGGSNTQIQFNNSSAFGGSSGMTWDGTTLAASNLSTAILTTTADASINGLAVGMGGGAQATNTAVGADALTANSSGTVNTAVGKGALQTMATHFGSTAVGENALNVNDNNQNTAVGWQALAAATGFGNVAIGSQAGADQTTGNNKLWISNGAASTLIYGDFGTPKLLINAQSTPSFLSSDVFQVNGSSYFADSTIHTKRSGYSGNFGSSFLPHSFVDKNYTDSAIAANAGGGGSFYQTVQSNTTSRTQRAKLNFGTQFSVTDNSGNGSTDVKVDSSSAGGYMSRGSAKKTTDSILALIPASTNGTVAIVGDADYTIAAGVEYVAFYTTLTANRVCTLPAASSNTNRHIRIHFSSIFTGGFQVNPTSPSTNIFFNSSTPQNSIGVNTANFTLDFGSDGTNWYVL